MKSVSQRLSVRLALISLVAVVPAIVAIVYLQAVERDRARERTLTDNLRLARLAASQQANVFDGASRLLLTLAAFPALRGEDPRPCSRLLADVLRSHPTYVNLSVARTDGSLFCSGAPFDPHLLASAEGRPWFQRAIRTRTTALGEPGRSATSGKPAIMLSQPLLDSSGVVVRVLAANIGLDELTRIASQVELPKGATITLFDHTRTILARFPNPEAWNGKQMPDAAALERLSGGASEDLREGTGVDGVRRLYATVPVNTSFSAGLFLGLGVDHATAFAASDHILRAYLELMAIVLLTGLGAAVIGGKTFVLGPIRAVRAVADRLAAGDLSARAQLTRGVGGVNELVDAVNGMAAALHERQSERDRAETDLRVAEERMRFALEVSAVGVWEANLKEDSSHWSETMEAMHGLAPGTFGGHFAASLEAIVPEDREMVREAVNHAIETRTNMAVEYRTAWSDGTIHRISSSGHFFYDSTGPLRGAGVAIDITDRRLLEEQLRQSQKMEAVGQLAGGIAHDFNNLLTIISGNTQLALVALPTDSMAREDLELSLAAANRAAQLTRQLLAFSRKQVFQATPVDVQELVQQVAPMLRRVLREDIAVECVTACEDAITLADRSQLEQTILNLSLNARDAMPSGGTLRIVCDTVFLDAMSIARRGLEIRPGDYAQVTVSDTGTGMEPEVLARVFEPFFTTKPVGKGTGLGLPSVYGIVKQFGGHIGIESAPGRGTTVTILLPRVTTDAAIGEDVSAESESLVADQATILLVEDEGAVRQLAVRILQRAGYHVLQAGNGKDALQTAKEYPEEIHLVLSDVVMPGLSAADLMAGMHAARPRAATLLMSGYPKDEIMRRGLENHDFALMEKPFTPEILLARVRQALRERSVRSRNWSALTPKVGSLA